MSSSSLGNPDFTRRKNRRKTIRTAAQVLLIGGIVGAALWAHFTTPVYKPSHDAAPRSNGFIALSYIGVQKNEGGRVLISESNLEAQLAALKRQGYETVTTDDVYEYYKNGKELPEKSLYLMFEDGRRDTAIFATPLLREFNYHATTMTYPEKFDRGDTKFLLPDDLKRLKEETFWDAGTNGYRLYYINVFDRYGNYLGEMDPLLYNKVTPYLGRRYNHYLMDYIRDKNGVPKESYSRMKSRVQYDYEKLRDVYTKDLGYVPKVSVLMHANTGEFGNNPDVSAVNAYWIQKLFAMNFNREGYSLNVPNSSIYDLTRMQPQAWWPVNHLLMRIKYDTGKDMIFNTGEEDRYNLWDLTQGAVEFKDETIFLTTLPNSTGRIVLRNSFSYPNVNVSTELDGNNVGIQAIYLRADKTLKNYIVVEVKNNYLLVNEVTNGAVKTLYKKSVDELQGKKPISVDEDKHDAAVAELEAFTRYAPSQGIAGVYLDRLKDQTKETPKTVDQGAKQYEPVVRNQDQGIYQLDINLTGSKLSLKFDGKDAGDVTVSRTQQGELMLGADWNVQGWQQRNWDDDVYDGVFKNFTVTDADTGNVLFTSKYSGWELIKYKAAQYFDKVVAWFVNYL